MKHLLQAIALGSLIFLTMFSSQTPLSAQQAIAATSVAVRTLRQPWLGFGVNEYPILRDANAMDIPWTPAALALTEQRIDALQPSVVRINWNRDWFNPSGIVGDYDWSSAKAQDVFHLLAYFHDHSIPVQIGLWHTLPNGQDSDTVYTSPGFAQLEADLLHELIIVKNYDTIRWYSGVNLPLPCA